MTCKQSQPDKILKLLKRGWLSPADAFQRGAGMKLATRVSELRAAGHKIVDKWAEGRAFKMYRISR